MEILEFSHILILSLALNLRYNRYYVFGVKI